MLKRVASLIAIGIAVFMLVGCGGGGSKSNSSQKDFTPLAHGKWTVLVYMTADDVLDDAVTDDINEMERGYPVTADVASNIRVLVEADHQNVVYNYDSYGNPTSIKHRYSGTQRYMITHDESTSIASPSVTIGEQNMGNPQTLNDFLAWGKSIAPADHYVVIVWDHGSGWDYYNDHVSARAISSDPDSGTVIRDIDLPAAFASMNGQIDVLGLDACLMNTIEVAYEVKDSARYQVGSTAPTPLEGFDYTKALNYLVANIDNTDGNSVAKGLAIAIAHDTNETWQDDIYDFYFTSAIDLSKIDNVVSKLDTLSEQLNSYVNNANSNKMSQIRNATLAYYGYNTYPQEYAYDRNLYDMGDYALQVSQMITDNTAVQQSANDLKSAVDSCILPGSLCYTILPGGQPSIATQAPRTSGLSFYLPTAYVFNRYAANSYGALSLSSVAPNWINWLKNTYNQ